MVAPHFLKKKFQSVDGAIEVIPGQQVCRKIAVDFGIGESQWETKPVPSKSPSSWLKVNLWMQSTFGLYKRVRGHLNVYECREARPAVRCEGFVFEE